MSFLWVGSQIPLYLYGSVLLDIYSEIGGANGRYVWMVIGYLIPNAALCPFVGALSDLFGRKMVAAFGLVLLIVGPVVVSTANTINVAIGGMVIAGLGAGLNELIALAGTSEMVPIPKRASYVGGVVFTILPFCPSPLWAQLITKDSNWRYVGALIGAWNAAGLLLVAFCYKDPVILEKPKAREILSKVDYIGGLLSIGGITTFMMGLQWGARQYSWSDPHVLAPLIIGVVLIVAFFLWELFGAKHPMVPPALFSKDKRTMILILLTTFFSGANFFVVLLFWPTEVYNLYGNDPVQIGIRALPIGFGIVGGAVISLVLIGLTKGRTKYLMIFWTCSMTAFTGSMSVANTQNLTPTVYPLITFAAISVGAVIIPCSIIAQIICPTELIGTVTAITLSIRYVGGAVGFTAFYNVFFHKFETMSATVAGPAIAGQGVSKDYFELISLITLASNAQFEQLMELIQTSPTVMRKDQAYGIIVDAVQKAFAKAYQWPYYISIAFGGARSDIAKAVREPRGPDSPAPERPPSKELTEPVDGSEKI
ncbi:hypothetical protein PRZ48_011044 [Zasmidium cellare]|uniref:Major facilitator superfamily (MFS) profile domain-containing protein n=1 Tax=Zasmidium cellare TaxID=395010 RepID=A0ABR0EAW3_ZASCE|nr:hypothetical protein PRZ48_011044 [Zasmidium cellare]